LVEPVDPEILRQTLQYLSEDIEIAGVKVGILSTAAAVDVICDFFVDFGIPVSKIVVDPVLRSSSGHDLLSPAGVERLKSRLLPLAGWVTPNLDELAILAGFPVTSRESVPDLVEQLAAKYPVLNIVVTGGHLDSPDDFLRTADGHKQWFPGERIETRATHGTGCAFSSALLARLIAGDQPADAVLAAKTYVAEAMKAARPIGKGRGPLHHLYQWG
jgi:hydroxymethylpyrimidine/phosphomethylpyrimidine kinase